MVRLRGHSVLVFFPYTPYDRGNCVAARRSKQTRQILAKTYLGFRHQEDSNLHTPFAGDNTQTRLASSYMNHSLYMPQGSNCLGWGMPHYIAHLRSKKRNIPPCSWPRPYRWNFPPWYPLVASRYVWCCWQSAWSMHQGWAFRHLVRGLHKSE